MPGWSAYNYCANNPINSFYPDGRKVVDSHNRTVSITRQSDGSLKYGSNPTPAIFRICNALNKTKTGIKQLNSMIDSKINVHLNISEENLIVKEGNQTKRRFGGTIQVNFNEKENYGKYQKEDGSFGIKEASITIYEGSDKDKLSSGTSKFDGLTLDEAIGVVAGQEIVHGPDGKEINEDIKWEIKGKKGRRPNGEVKSNKIENKTIEESREN